MRRCLQPRLLVAVAVACFRRRSCLFLPLLLLVSAVILSAAKDPGTLSTTDTARTLQPRTSSRPGKRRKLRQNPCQAPTITKKRQIPNKDAPKITARKLPKESIAFCKLDTEIQTRINQNKSLGHLSLSLLFARF
jgi:hypothetical protein